MLISMEQNMVAMFLAKRGTIKTCNVSSFLKNDNNSVRYVAVASESNEREKKSKPEAMGKTTDGKAPNVTLSHAADTSRDGLRRAIDVATEEHGVARKSEGDEENVAVGENGTVKGENQSSG